MSTRLVIVVRDAQIAAMGHETLVGRLAAHAHAYFGASPGDELLHDLVRRARSFGVRSDRGMHRFLNLALQYGPAFADAPQPWMRPYLDDPEVPDAEERIARLQAEAVDRLQREADAAGSGR